MNQISIKNHISLFSGQGGFDLAAQRMGWRNRAHCEWNPFASHILKYWWPKADAYSDIHEVDFTLYENKIFILSGGFPCQPYSQAGLMKGKEDERHLWPQMLRAISECKPAWVVGENVKGLVNWNNGEVFEDICKDLENLGFKVQPYLIPAAGVGAPHLRERIWFVAFNQENRNNLIDDYEPILPGENVFDSSAIELNFWDNFPTYHPITTKNSEIAQQFNQNAIIWQDKKLKFNKWKVEAIKCGGNAIVHQVALEIFKSIDIFESKYTHESIAV